MSAQVCFLVVIPLVCALDSAERAPNAVRFHRVHGGHAHAHLGPARAEAPLAARTLEHVRYRRLPDVGGQDHAAIAREGCGGREGKGRGGVGWKTQPRYLLWTMSRSRTMFIVGARDALDQVDRDTGLIAGVSWRSRLCAFNPRFLFLLSRKGCNKKQTRETS